MVVCGIVAAAPAVLGRTHAHKHNVLVARVPNLCDPDSVIAQLAGLDHDAGNRRGARQTRKHEQGTRRKENRAFHVSSLPTQILWADITFHGNTCQRGLLCILELRESLGLDVKTGLCLLGFACHGTEGSIMLDIGVLIVPAAKKPDDRQFKVGDKVRVNLHHGKIEDATVRAVIHDDDGTKLQVDVGLDLTALIDTRQVVE